MPRVLKELIFYCLRGGLLSFLLLSWQGAWARMDTIPGPRYTSARGAAMGDAILSLADTPAEALFYNPAALGRVKRNHFSPLNFSVMGNHKFFGLMDTSNILKGHSLDSYAPTLAENRAVRSGVGATLLPSGSIAGFGFALLIDADMHARDFGGTTVYRSNYKVIPALGYSLSLARGIVKIGYSLQWVNLSEGEVSVASGTAVGYNQGINDGAAFAHTVGIALDYPVAMLPSLNLVVRNLGGASYGSSTLYSFAENPVGTPADEEMSFDIELGLKPRMRAGGSMNITAAWRDVTNQSGYTLLRRVAGGIEFVYRGLVNLRAGYGAGYPSFGIGLKREKAEFNLSWWSEMIGTSSLIQRDIRMMLNYQIRI